MQSFQINDFSGGMNDWVDPGLLGNGALAKLVNGEVSSGKIVPVRGPSNLNDGVAEHNTPVYYGHYGTRDRSVVKFYNRHYWSNNTATQAPWYGGDVENYLGIPYPAYSGSAPNVSIAAASPGAGQNGLSGVFRYCVTFVNANGFEGAPGSLEEYDTNITLASQIANITVTWSDSKIAYAKIYRTIDHGADFYCIGEISSSGSTFADDTPDDTAQLLNPLTTVDAYPPPDGGKFLTEYGGVFFLAVGDLCYFSTQGNPHSWPKTQFISCDDPITGITPEFQGVLVFTRNSVYRITGADSPETVTKNYIPGNHGCISFRSIAVLNNAPLWASYDGLCLWDGSSISVVNYRVKHLENPAVKYAVACRDCYWLFLTSGTVVFDRKNGDVFYELDSTFDYAWYDAENNLLYLMGGGSIYTYGSGNLLRCICRTGAIGSGIPGTRIFREISTQCDGASTIRAIVDGTCVAEVALGAGKQRLKLPLNAVGSHLEVEMSFKATLHNITVLYE